MIRTEEEKNTSQQLEEIVVEINDHNYDPQELTIQKGSDVQFVNNTDELHSVTSQADGFDLELDGNETATVSFPDQGVFDYYCRYHPEMKGTIVVEERL